MQHGKIEERNFSGFSPQALSFLSGIKQNNTKAWFEAHKAEYRKHLLEPLQNLALDLSPGMLEIDPLLMVGVKAVSRIQRDTRFSGHKAPYKSAMWIGFKRPVKEWTDSPAYFFEITPDAYRYGMGFYSAAPDTMRKFRQVVDEKPQAFKKAITFYPRQKTFVLEGETYKKLFDPAKPEEIQTWYQRKSFYLVCNRDIDERLFNSELADDLLEGFTLLSPLYQYLLNLKNPEFLP